MKKQITLSLLMAGLMSVAGIASAQNNTPAVNKSAEATPAGQTAVGATGQNTRADVKADAAAANKAGDTSKGTMGAPASTATGQNSRADVKADARNANKAGDVSKGTQGAVAQDQKPGSSSTKMTRAERKAARDMKRAQRKAANPPKGSAEALKGTTEGTPTK